MRGRGRRARRQLVRGVVLVAAGVTLAAATIAIAWRLARGRSHEPAITLDCEIGPTTRGIDVSYYQETINWPKVKASGVEFVFVRVSDGLYFDDPMFAANWAGTKSSNLIRGAYQFFRPEQDPIEQADVLVAALLADPGELPPVIDVEDAGGQSPAEIARRVKIWLARVHDRLGLDAIVYTGPAFWRDSVGGAEVDRPLWIAHYTSECPQIPAPWTSWRFWQFTASGRVPGIYGPVDLDVFRGTPDELRSTLLRVATSPTTPPAHHTNLLSRARPAQALAPVKKPAPSSSGDAATTPSNKGRSVTIRASPRQ